MLAKCWHRELTTGGGVGAGIGLWGRGKALFKKIKVTALCENFLGVLDTKTENRTVMHVGLQYMF